MLVKTKAIVLGQIKYRESSLISNLYTEQLGFRSYVVNGVRSTKKPGRSALFQPLTILEIVAYEKKESGLQRIAEFRCFHPFSSIPFNTNKTTVAIFLAEVLSRVLINEIDHHQECYQFLEQTIIKLDQAETDFENTHLLILAKLLYFIGFSLEKSIDSLFDFAGVEEKLMSRNIAVEDIKLKISSLLNEESIKVKFSHQERRIVLWLLVNFYQHQIENLGKINSYEVMRELY